MTTKTDATALAPEASPRPMDRPTKPIAPTTNEKVIDLATQTAALPMDDTILLGIFGGRDDQQALVRQADGAVRKLRPGDHVGRNQVLAITDETVYLAFDGNVSRLTIPGA